MRKYLAITIDVEPDCSTNWTYSSPLMFAGVSAGIAGRLQPLFNRFSIAPTYLINNVVLEDNASCKILQQLPGRFELGTHLHPEFIEPMKTTFNYAGQKGVANCCFYPADIETQKIQTITSLFSDRFGFAPKSFRAGRFSAGNNTIASLAALGYFVDTSVTPHVIWNDHTRERPVDYTRAPQQPYFMDGNDMLREGPGPVLQVPVSIIRTRTQFTAELRRTYFGLRHRWRSTKPLWLRPVFSNLDEFVSITNEYAEQYSGEDMVVYNMMFHNVEVLPGLSPYTRTEADCAAYLRQLETFFVYCAENGIESVTLTDLYALYKKN